MIFNRIVILYAVLLLMICIAFFVEGGVLLHRNILDFGRNRWYYLRVCVHINGLAAPASEPTAHSDSKLYRAIINFTAVDDDNAAAWYTIKSLCTNPSPVVGTHIRVKYDPDDPQKLVDDSFANMFGSSIICFLIGICLPAPLVLCFCVGGEKTVATTYDDRTVDTCASVDSADDEMQMPPIVIK